MSAPVETEALVVGAGPCGLFSVFELGLLGIRTQVVETLAEPGGQCSVLYPEKPIYDIPALPVVMARELVDRLLEQIAPFDPVIHYEQELVSLETLRSGRFRARTSGGVEFDAGTVVIAGGIGSFQPRRLRIAGAAAHEDRDLHYRVTDRERFRDRRLVILGGGDSALDWTLDLHPIARSVTLVHRREEFRAAPISVTRMRELERDDPARMRCLIGKITELIDAGGALRGVVVAAAATGEPHSIECDELLVFYGLKPSLGPIADWGLDIEKRQLAVDPETFATNVPGIFAIGDVSVYPGKKKLILTGFYEGAIAAYSVQKHLYPDVKQSVLYTTTSSTLQKRLGVRD